MKTKEIQVPKRIYVCEVCGKEDEWDTVIRACEKRCKVENCEHQFNYVLGDATALSAGATITKECTLCGTGGRRTISQSDIDGVIRRLFEDV